MHPPAPTTFVLRPTVILALVYAELVSAWGVWTICTTRLPESGEPLRLLPHGALVALTAVHVALFAALVADGILARRSGPGLRRGHLAGIALAVPALALLQWTALLAHRPIPVG
jgi:hypothetical protein